MSSGPFPDRVDAARWFARFGRIETSIPLTRLPRLVPYLADPEGQASVMLQFGLDEEGRKLLTGLIEANLNLTCQRCLQALSYKVTSDVALLVFSDRTELDKQLPGQFLEAIDRDVLVLDEMTPTGSEELDLQTLVEDELILALPLAPVHEDERCSEALNQLRDLDLASGGSESVQKANPFAVLAGLKQAGDGKAR